MLLAIGKLGHCDGPFAREQENSSHLFKSALRENWQRGACMIARIPFSVSLLMPYMCIAGRPTRASRGFRFTFFRRKTPDREDSSCFSSFKILDHNFLLFQ